MNFQFHPCNLKNSMLGGFCQEGNRVNLQPIKMLAGEFTPQEAEKSLIGLYREGFIAIPSRGQ